MKVGIIGSGIVAQTLGKAFLTEGDEVMLGSRDTKKEAVTKWKAANPSAKSGSFADAAAFGELLVLATAGHGAMAGPSGCRAEKSGGQDHHRCDQSDCAGSS